MTNMIAFHGKQEIKDLYVARMRAHHAADEIIQRYGYWEAGKGCAVGCTLHSDNHAAAEAEIGFPEALMWLEDRVFESLPGAAQSANFALAFLERTPVGADLSLVIPRLMLWLLREELPQHVDAKFTDVHEVLAQVAGLYERRIAGESVTDEEFTTAAARAEAARAEAARAAYAAAYAAEAAYAAARAVARAAAYAAARADAAAWERIAEKLLELLAAAPVAAQTV